MRHRLTNHGKNGADIIHKAVAVRGRCNAHGKSNQNSDDHRKQRQFQRHRKSLYDGICHRLSTDERFAEIAFHNAADPLEIPNHGRIIQSQLFAQGGDLLRACIRCCKGIRGIARQSIEQHEKDNADYQQNRNCRQQFFDNVT